LGVAQSYVTGVQFQCVGLDGANADEDEVFVIDNIDVLVNGQPIDCEDFTVLPPDTPIN
jgi:hypothetical protein